MNFTSYFGFSSHLVLCVLAGPCLVFFCIDNGENCEKSYHTLRATSHVELEVEKIFKLADFAVPEDSVTSLHRL